MINRSQLINLQYFLRLDKVLTIGEIETVVNTVYNVSIISISLLLITKAV